MIKRTAIAIALILVGLLYILFSPSVYNVDELYQAYLDTSTRQLTDEELISISEVEQVKLTKLVREDGKLRVQFPIKIKEGYVVSDGDVFNTYGTNNWRAVTKVMPSGYIRKPSKHGGTDITVRKNGQTVMDAEVIAMTKSKILEVGKDSSRGNYVKLQDEKTKLIFTYMHMANNSIVVAKNQQVEQGAKVGIVGTTGSSTGEHLHVGVSYPGTDNAFEGVSVGRSSNLLDMYDPKYFSFIKEYFPTQFNKNPDRKFDIIVE